MRTSYFLQSQSIQISNNLDETEPPRKSLDNMRRPVIATIPNEFYTDVLYFLPQCVLSEYLEFMQPKQKMFDKYGANNVRVQLFIFRIFTKHRVRKYTKYVQKLWRPIPYFPFSSIYDPCNVRVGLKRQILESPYLDMFCAVIFRVCSVLFKILAIYME